MVGISVEGGEDGKGMDAQERAIHIIEKHPIVACKDSRVVISDRPKACTAI